MASLPEPNPLAEEAALEAQVLRDKHTQSGVVALLLEIAVQLAKMRAAIYRAKDKN